MIELQSKGFFIMDDGQRSCDVVIKPKKKKGADNSQQKPVKTRERATQTIMDTK